MPVAIKVDVEIDGTLHGLAELSRRFPGVVDDSMAAGALRVAGNAKRSLITGPKTGRVYKRKSVTHQASAPGEAPASDHGDLLSHIFPESGRGFAFVGATVLHGLWLEEGAKNLKPRPWLVPALEKDANNIEADLLRRLEAL